MLDRLQIIKQRFDEISDLIIQPDVIADQKRYVQLNKEYKDMKALVEKRDEYVKLVGNMKEAQEIIADGSDAEMVEMAYQASVSSNKQAGNFSKPFQDGQQDGAFGDEPILVSTVHIGINANRPLTINFCPSAGVGLEIAFTPQVLHGFCALLQQVVITAEWDLELKLPASSHVYDASMILN